MTRLVHYYAEPGSCDAREVGKSGQETKKRAESVSKYAFGSFK
jgi:hypothetical protein